ncbi:glycine zipper 2TM domain-containing protein [Paucibacter sp. Y2R2-4]|uniref:glycine zipper 2TM domain-containing protein n=1 Tax=Paucibacter sp. Y2R2-4 TaxID=2893553 RepID=UPI0021E46F63|nr:glycine zipper 2TM domain-containing protein [Paucibacter sp. Y2R2-4]MCV2349983.1 glycine zipper 2TM domain-containing protein [Paucibacter sp. Y2R2-4]
MKMNKFALAASVLAVAMLSACSTSNPDVIQRNEAQRMSQVQDATLLSVRAVTVDGSQSGVGAVAGGVVGAVAGSNVGGRTEGQIAGVLVGLAGAAVGNAIERNVTKEEAVEMLVQLRNGERRAIVQAKGSEVLTPGEAVILVTTGGKTRVMRAPPVSSVNKS